VSKILVRADKVPVHLVDATGHQPLPRKLVVDEKVPGGQRDTAMLYPGDPPIEVDDEVRYYARRLAVGDLVKVEAVIADVSTKDLHTSAMKRAPLVGAKDKE
jgi:hypothetical protein